MFEVNVSQDKELSRSVQNDLLSLKFGSVLVPKIAVVFGLDVFSLTTKLGFRLEIGMDVLFL